MATSTDGDQPTTSEEAGERADAKAEAKKPAKTEPKKPSETGAEAKQSTPAEAKKPARAEPKKPAGTGAGTKKPGQAAAAPKTGKASTTKPAKAKQPAGKTAPKKGGTPKPPPPKKRSSSAHKSQIDGLRKSLTQASEAHWREYLEALGPRLPKPPEETATADPRPPARGDWVKLEGVDYTRQSEGESHPVVVFTDEARQNWAILLDNRLTALIEVGADVELAFRFERQTQWDIVGRVAGYNVIFDRYARAREFPVVRVNAMRRPDQFVVFHHPKDGPQVPDLASNREKLETIHDTLKIPKVAEPRELLETLLTIIETGNFPRFVDISVEPPDPRVLRRRFEQFVKVYRECGGRLVFERYDSRASPESPGPDGDVKMFIARTDPDGRQASKPLTFTKRGSSWLLKTGIF